ncbi:hypothetical protein [Methylobacterium soli]|uniref:Uncharacterized protein n=1 Tax=Methylobacterium soli TaxID=553447 RepID=A0A6L3SUK1_9HYPH|nr:hypothetical protein [Methylobacterium soli]KAB1074129.1 hypothetical protein F6X53_26400 [Methylobacterium soli]
MSGPVIVLMGFALALLARALQRSDIFLFDSGFAEREILEPRGLKRSSPSTSSPSRVTVT